MDSTEAHKSGLPERCLSPGVRYRHATRRRCGYGNNAQSSLETSWAHCMASCPWVSRAGVQGWFSVSYEGDNVSSDMVSSAVGPGLSYGNYRKETCWS